MSRRNGRDARRSGKSERMTRKAKIKNNKRGRPRYDQEDLAAAQAFRAIGRKIRLSRGDVRPLWVQLRNQIEEAINTGGIAANSRMPSEQALCDLFGISRAVVRAAIGSLATGGRVVRLPRKGTFVAPPRQHVDFMAANLGVFDDLTAKGHRVSTRTLALYRSAPNEQEQNVLGLPPEGSVVHIHRVYLSDGLPITMTHIALPGHKVPGLELLDMENHSVFQTIREHYGLTVQRAERWFTAALPSKEECERMGVSPNTPLISIESFAYDAEGAVLEYYQALYNSSLARIHVAINQEAPLVVINGLVHGTGT